MGEMFPLLFFSKKINTYLFSFTKIARCSFGLGIVEVKSVIVVEVTLKNTDKLQINTTKNTSSHEKTTLKIHPPHLSQII